MGGLGVDDITMGVDPRALLGARLRLRARDGARDMSASVLDRGLRFPRVSDLGEGKYPESLLEEESTVKAYTRLRSPVELFGARLCLVVTSGMRNGPHCSGMRRTNGAFDRGGVGKCG